MRELFHVRRERSVPLFGYLFAFLGILTDSAKGSDAFLSAPSDVNLILRWRRGARSHVPQAMDKHALRHRSWRRGQVGQLS